MTNPDFHDPSSHRPRNWFDFASAAERIATVELAMRGAQPMDRITPEQWGIRGIGVIAVGSYEVMMRQSEYRRRLKLYDAGACGRNVADRLPIWC